MAHSQDLNPIDHVWKALEGNIHDLEAAFEYLKRKNYNIEWAKEIITAAWSEVDKGLIITLIQSLEDLVHQLSKLDKMPFLLCESGIIWVRNSTLKVVGCIWWVVRCSRKMLLVQFSSYKL